jgi:hypothetical protein
MSPKCQEESARSFNDLVTTLGLAIIYGRSLRQPICKRDFWSTIQCGFIGRPEEHMATFVLVHGAWHGAWCWRRVVRLLTRAGHDVFAPALTGFCERSHLLTPAVDLRLRQEQASNGAAS